MLYNNSSLLALRNQVVITKMTQMFFLIHVFDTVMFKQTIKRKTSLPGLNELILFYSLILSFLINVRSS
jgi:hypothetical protein